MMHWVRMGFLALLGLVAFGYAADWVIYRLEGSPHSHFTVSHFVSAPLKDNKDEMDYTGSDVVPCSIALFPQDGNTPCWWLRKHTNDVKRY